MADSTNTVVCCQCKYRANSGSESGFCSVVKEYVSRKNSRASTCDKFKKREGVK